MRNLKAPLLLLLAFALLSCAPGPNPKFGLEQRGDCGEVPAGVTIEKGELDLAGAKLGDFSLAKLEIKYTPEFQRIISEAATNALVHDYIVCKAIARAGVQGDPEMVSYFMRLTQFLSTRPTGEQQTQWRQANPIPRQKGNPGLSKEPEISQYSRGTNSPNIIGDQNNVTIITPTDKSPERVPSDMVDDKKIYVECEHKTYASGLPTDGKLKALVFIHRTPTTTVTASEFQNIGSPAIRTDLLNKWRGGLVCQITNYGTVPVLKLQISFGLRFLETKWLNSRGSFTHRPKGSETWTSQIRKLDPWPAERFEFLLKNETNDWLEVSIPEFVELQTLGESKKRKAPLLRPDDDPMHLGTFYKSVFLFTPADWPQHPPADLPEN